MTLIDMSAERDINQAPVNERVPQPEPAEELPPITGTMDVRDAEDALDERRKPDPGTD